MEGPFGVFARQMSSHPDGRDVSTAHRFAGSACDRGTWRAPGTGGDATVPDGELASGSDHVPDPDSVNGL